MHKCLACGGEHTTTIETHLCRPTRPRSDMTDELKLHSLPSLKEVLRWEEPASLPSIVANLLEASKILYHHLSFDGHGHEVLQSQMQDAQIWLDWMQERGLVDPPPTFNTK